MKYTLRKQTGNKNLQLYNKKYPYLQSVLDNSFADRIVKFHSGPYAGNRIVNFTLLKTSAQNKSIIYSFKGDSDSVVKQVSSYYKALGYNKWVLKKSLEDRLKTIPDYDSSLMSTMQKRIVSHYKSLLRFKKIAISLTRNPKEIENSGDASGTVKIGLKMVDNALANIKQLNTDLKSFISSPTDETLAQLGKSAGLMGSAQKVTTHA